MPVIEYYRKQNKVAQVDSTVEIEEVHKNTVTVVEKILAREFVVKA